MPGSSKGGDTGVRTVLIYGARSVLAHSRQPRQWGTHLLQRRAANVALSRDAFRANSPAPETWRTGSPASSCAASAAPGRWPLAATRGLRRGASGPAGQGPRQAQPQLLVEVARR